MTIKEVPDTISIEVEYTYTHEKGSEPETSWYYVWVETDKEEKAIISAKKHFMEMIKESNWTSKVKIVSIHRMHNDKSKPAVKSVSPVELPAGRSTGTVFADSDKPATTRNKRTTPTTKAKSTRSVARGPANGARKPATKRSNKSTS